MFSEEFLRKNCHKSGNQIAKEQGLDPGNVRTALRALKGKYPDLEWYADPRHKTETRTLRGIAGYDLHFPHHHKKLWKNVLRFCADFKPDVFLLGGDNLNIDALDHWALDSKRFRKLEGKRLTREYRGFNDRILAPLGEVLDEETRRIILLGNHEQWVEHYIDKHPQLEGFLEVRRNLDLDGWEVYDYGLCAKVGKLYFHHGEYFNKHSAAKTVEVFGRNMVFGHGHTSQTFTAVSPVDAEAHAATQLPCMCSRNPHYRRNKSNAWVNGFGVFHIREDESFNLYPVIAVDGEFTAPDGKVYE